MDPHRAEGAVKRRATGQAPRGHRRSNPLRRSEERHRGETGVMPSVRRCRRARPPSARAPRSPAPARAFPRRDRARDRERAVKDVTMRPVPPRLAGPSVANHSEVVSPRAGCRLAFTQVARTPSSPHATQWVNTPRGASGSSTSSASDRASSGANRSGLVRAAEKHGASATSLRALIRKSLDAGLGLQRGPVWGAKTRCTA
jgi:hypothetical protein